MFKRCSVCGTEWTSRGRFLEDPDIELVGYQVNFRKLSVGLLLFNHACKGATLATRVLEFKDLYDGPVFKSRLTGNEPCPGHCLHRDDLEPCPEHCECAFVRSIMKTISNWPKTYPLGCRRTDSR